MRQPGLGISGPAGQHQRGPDLIGGELIGNRPAARLVVRTDTVQPDFDHGCHHLGTLVVDLPIPGLEHRYAIETRQPGKIDLREHVSQLRPWRDIRQTLGNHLATGHESTLQPDTDKIGCAMMGHGTGTDDGLGTWSGAGRGVPLVDPFPGT
jgi:hypothetical protein